MYFILSDDSYLNANHIESITVELNFINIVTKTGRIYTINVCVDNNIDKAYEIAKDTAKEMLNAMEETKKFLYDLRPNYQMKEKS